MSDDVGDKVIVDPEPSSIVLKSNSIYYRAIATRIEEGSRIFVREIGRKQASYARKRFGKLLGREVLGYPVQVGGKDGYLFHLRKERSQK